MKKKDLEKYLNDKACEIGEHLHNEHNLEVDVFISIERNGKEQAAGSNLTT